MPVTDPMTPPDLLAQRKRTGWKPDAQGRLVFRPRGVSGPGYVVETAEQLQRAERFQGTKLTWGVVTVGAAMGSILTMQSSDDLGSAIGSVAVVLALTAGLVFHSLTSGWRVVTQTAMRPLP